MALLQYIPGFATPPSNFRLAGMKRFSHFFGKIFYPHMAVIDRTGTLSLPVKTASLYAIPAFEKSFAKSYGQICDERAVQLLRHAETLDVTMYVSWSGGIDSTCVLVSLLRNATPSQKKRIAVLLSEESIAENPRFYEDHVRRNLRRESTSIFPYVLGTNDIYVNGELNDQLFGAQAPGELMYLHGDDFVHRPFKREFLFEYFNTNIGDPVITNFYLDLFERVVAAAPMEIRSYFDYFWWLNFALKWQSVALRVLAFTTPRNAHRVSSEYFYNHFFPFYGTDDFQRWSMHNLDKRIKDTWKTYKWPAKDYIFDFTRDAEYRDNKLKKGSLFFMVVQQSEFAFIDDSFRLTRTWEDAYYEPDNEFIE